MEDNLEQVYPLSYGQQALWFMYQSAPERAMYQFSYPVHIRSMVNVAALQKALQALLQRHPCLRTTFLADRSGLRQIVHKDAVPSFEIIDVSKDSQDEISRLVSNTWRKPFDLVRGPVIRTHLFTRTPTDHILSITVHHIVYDFVSVKVLLDDLFALYALAKEGKGDSLPPLLTTYADFVRWENDFCASAEGKAQLDYWRQQLSGTLPVLNLPANHRRPSTQTYQGISNKFKIPVAQTERLRNLARAEGAALYTVLMAAYQVLLYRYCNQDEILVGMATSGRRRGAFDGTIGFFVNSIVLKSSVKGEPAFREFLAQVGDTIKEALAHQDYPFPLLVESLQPNRDPSHPHIFQADFNYFRPRGEDFKNYIAGLPVVTDALTYERYPHSVQEGMFDIALEIEEVHDTLNCDLRGKTDWFDADGLARMSGHFRVLLEAIAANPSQRISDLPLLTEEEEHRLLAELNDTQVPYPNHLCLQHLFEESAERDPDAIAVEFAGLQLTYFQLNQKANRLAHHLQALGVKPETTVGVFLDRSVEMMIGFLGVLKAGGAFIAVDPISPPERRKFLFADAGISTLLTVARYRAQLSFLEAPVICLDTDSPAWSETRADNPSSGVQPENLAYLTYTSGSTGKPKGVMIEHRSVVNHNFAIVNQYELTAQDRVLQFSKINFDVAVEEIFPTLAAGGTVVLPQPEDLASINGFQRFIKTQKLTVLNLPSSFWHTWVSATRQDGFTLPENLRLIIIGSEIVNVTFLDKWRQIVPHSVQLINAYGLTETTISSLVWKSCTSSAKILHSVPIGRSLANIQVYILNDSRQLCPIGVPGELYLGGACLMRGYKDRPELDARAFVKNPWSDNRQARLFRTGDLARYLSDGNIEYLGRLDHQVKIRGHRIELDEIEAVLGDHPAVAENAVIVHNNQGEDACLIAYLVSRPGQFIDKEELQTFLRERLPEYMIPAALVPLDSLPHNPNGKTDRRALANLPINRELLSDDVFVAPRSADEKMLAEIWRDLLGLEKIGVFDSFFKLGGHSLMAAQLTARVCQAFNVDLPLQYLLQSPTIAGLAQAIARARTTGVEESTSKADIEMDTSVLDEILHDPPPLSSKEEDMLKGVDAILLTGVTGFLGSFLLAEFLRQSNAEIYCLVRPSANSEPLLRIKRVLESYSLWQEEYRLRIIPVTGDLAMPFLGLETSRFSELASRIDVIYHCGAWVNHLYPYSVLRATNVSGTLEVIRLAAAYKTKPVHFVSTFFHAQSGLDGNGMQGHNRFADGYVQSKWIAEKMVEQAGARGLPVCIFRPSRITGQQQTGVSNLHDFMNLLIKGCVQLGKVPKWGRMEEYLTPVDYVAGAIVYLSRHRGNYGKAFDLIHSHNPVSWDEILFDWLKSLGFNLHQISYSDWRTELSGQPTNALYPFFSLFPDQENFINDGETGAPPGDGRRSKDSQNTLTGLANSGLVCPPLSQELLRTYVCYLKGVGFLEAP